MPTSLIRHNILAGNANDRCAERGAEELDSLKKRNKPLKGADRARIQVGSVKYLSCDIPSDSPKEIEEEHPFYRETVSRHNIAYTRPGVSPLVAELFVIVTIKCLRIRDEQKQSAAGNQHVTYEPDTCVIVLHVLENIKTYDRIKLFRGKPGRIVA